MELLSWNPFYSVGVERLDEQHRRLIELLNGYANAVLERHGAEALGPLLEELVVYVAVHFRDEEGLLREHRYPELEDHLREHQALLDRLEELRGRHAAGQPLDNRPVIEFLFDWLQHHILGTDRRYGPFFNDLGIF